MRHVRDISLELAHHMPRYPSPYLPEVTIEAATTHEVEKRSAQIVRFGTHVSTHMDAQLHSVPNGKSISDIPAEWLFGEALHLDMRSGGFDRSKPISAEDFSKAGLDEDDPWIIGGQCILTCDRELVGYRTRRLQDPGRMEH